MPAIEDLFEKIVGGLGIYDSMFSESPLCPVLYIRSRVDLPNNIFPESALIYEIPSLLGWGLGEGC